MFEMKKELNLPPSKNAENIGLLKRKIERKLSRAKKRSSYSVLWKAYFLNCDLLETSLEIEGVTIDYLLLNDAITIIVDGKRVEVDLSDPIFAYFDSYDEENTNRENGVVTYGGRMRFDNVDLLETIQVCEKVPLSVKMGKLIGREEDLLYDILLDPGFNDKDAKLFLKHVYGIKPALKKRTSGEEDEMRETLIRDLLGSRPLYGLPSVEEFEIFLNCFFNCGAIITSPYSLCNLLGVKAFRKSK